MVVTGTLSGPGWSLTVRPMALPTMTRDDDVFVIDLGDDLNMATVAWVAAMNDLIDEVEAAAGPKGLVTTSSAPKHYSNGLDTPWMASADSAEIAAYVEVCFGLVHRIMLLGVPTGAAVTGHAFGLGAFLVLAHDQAVMREDRGYWNLPEVHLGMSFPRPLMSVIDARLSHGERRRAVLVGHRYTGPDAARAGIVDAVAPRESLVEEVVERVSAVSGSAGENLSLIKRQLYPEIASIAAS